MIAHIIFFFFSSRRRHTRYIGDWSSDVCSYDLSSFWREGGSSTPRYSRSKTSRPRARAPRKRAASDVSKMAPNEIGRASCRERVEVAGGEEGGEGRAG